ncbi:UDP-N-acetylmuramoyl-L-alanine--D-glutamate ligase [Granulibacter bethesdensis]|uniref:UDP-N-acetylmuramoyl-L-alanine--D-glutamate ligase n=1 Tax=Granulibacter bethesdensis TaxID=364410 RepID=UPI00090B7192|nr:UDP-N-acetylmuramoyl-L-alanine--D-glutamate ligase [Granulibacter bethesdensis]APH58738.1 UDP-N-acetylmuramoylalanine--D-glutamate ligase [Granulibacter bethesdensis]
MSGFSDRLLHGKRYGVLGLGRNGLPAAQALTAMGADVTVWDDGEAARREAGNAGLTVSPLSVEGLDALILSPGIPHRLPKPHPVAVAALQAGVPVLSDAELLYQAVRLSGSRARFVGITGTNGKSTTTALTAHILREAGCPVAAGGNLGPAALALPLLPDNGVYVLEMSSYMLERLQTLRFDAAAMLNLSPDHIDRHGDMAGYETAKREIFQRQTGADLAVLGIDDPLSAAMAETLRKDGHPARIALVSGALCGDTQAEYGMQFGTLTDMQGPILPMVQAAALPGAHNAQNAAIAAAITLFLGVKREQVAAGIASFPGLPHRQERIAEADGILWINDSKATNADSTARALICHERIIWIAGGIAKEGGIEDLVPLLPRVTHVLLIGRDAPILAETLRAHGVPHTDVGTLDNAVTMAAALVKESRSDVVLLSPACASFDQFAHFEARGDHFRSLVQQQIGGGA